MTWQHTNKIWKHRWNVLKYPCTWHCKRVKADVTIGTYIHVQKSTAPTHRHTFVQRQKKNPNFKRITPKPTSLSYITLPLTSNTRHDFHSGPPSRGFFFLHRKRICTGKKEKDFLHNYVDLSSCSPASSSGFFLGWGRGGQTIRHGWTLTNENCGGKR